MSDRLFIVIGTAAESTITVSRESATTDRVQGLVLDADHPLVVGEVRSDRIVLWSDNAPDSMEVVTTEAGQIRIWNVWRDGDLIQAWQGHAVMFVDDEGEDLGLSCRDGHEDQGCSLKVRLSFDRVWSQPESD